MGWRMRAKVLLGICISILACLIWSGSAMAAGITQSALTVDSPTGTYVIDDELTQNNQISLHGTSDGTTGDKVDINCYAGTSNKQLHDGVNVHADGKFSYSGNIGFINDETCVLRAVPAGDTSPHPPGTTSSFTGPRLAISSRSNTVISSGANTGKLSDFHIFESQLRGAFDYFSLGNCAIN